MLRFGRFFDTLHSALPVMSSVNDQLIRITSTLSRIASSCFMAIDHLVCLYKLGLLPKNSIDAGAWDKTSTRFWLYSIIMGIVRDVYEISKVYKEACQVQKRKITKGHHHHHSRNSAPAKATEDLLTLKGLPPNLNPTVRHCIVSARVAANCVTHHADITIDFVKNLCDLCIPLTVLGYIKMSPGTLGILGVISTIASAVPQINPMVKMVPAT